MEVKTLLLSTVALLSIAGATQLLRATSSDACKSKNAGDFCLLDRSTGSYKEGQCIQNDNSELLCRLTQK